MYYVGLIRVIWDYAGITGIAYGISRDLAVENQMWKKLENERGTSGPFRDKWSLGLGVYKSGESNGKEDGT